MIELHILDAARRLRPYRRSLKRGFRVARARVPRLLPVGDVDVVMQELPALTIAETGVGGYSPAADILYITDRAVRLAIAEKRLPATQVNGRYRIAREDIQHFAAAKAAQAA